MKEYKILLDCPTGYRPIALKAPEVGEKYVGTNDVVKVADHNMYCTFLVVEKIKPVERVFRLVSEKGQPKVGQFGLGANGSMLRYKEFNEWDAGEVWEEVTNASK